MKTSSIPPAIFAIFAFAAAAVAATSTDTMMVEDTTIFGGTEASDEGLWAPTALSGGQSSVSQVPEPGAASLLLGAALLGGSRTRNRAPRK